MCGYYLLRQQAGRLMPGYCLLQGGVEEEEVKHKHLYHAHKHTSTHRYVHMQPKYGNRQANANTIIYA